MTAFKFGPYLLLKNSAVLKRDGIDLPLTKRRHEILRLLVERAGDIVNKNELMEKVWGTQMVEENNLAQQVYTIRRLLGDDIRNQNYIETIPGVGYRFRGQVEEVELDELSAREPEGAPGLKRSALATDEGRLTAVVMKSFAAIVTLGLLIFLVGDLERVRGWLGRILQREPAATAVISPLISLPGIETHPTFSPNGRFLAFSWVEESAVNYDIYLIDLEEGAPPQPRRITSHPNLESHPVWSPDNREIAFLRIPDVAEERYHVIITRIEADGRSVEREVGRVWGGLDWSPDGQYLAVSESERPGESTSLHLLSVDGRTRRALTRPAAKENVFETTFRFSPAGDSIAFVRWVSDYHSDLFVVDVRSGKTRQLTFDRQAISAVDWSLNGQELFFTSNRQGNQRLWRIAASGGEARLVDGAPYDIHNLTISPRTGGIAYTSRLEDTDIHLRQISGSTESQPGPCSIRTSKAELNPNFSPDNQLIAFESTRTGGTEIWIARADCSSPVRLTNFNEPGVGSARWSPDGKKIVFNRFGEGRGEIYSIDIDGSNLRRLTNHPANDFTATWSHDGRSIYFVSDRTGILEIWRIDATGENPTRITSGGGRAPFASADGRYLFYTRHELLRFIDLRNNSDHPIPELDQIKVERYWYPTGDEIYFAPVKDNRRPQIRRFSLRTRKIEDLFDLDGILPVSVPGLSVTSDQKRIAFCSISYQLSNIMLIDGLK